MSLAMFEWWVFEPIEEAVDRLVAPYEEAEVDPREIDLELVAEFVSAKLLGVRCYVEQTGGGCATVYLGNTYTPRASDPLANHEVYAEQLKPGVLLFPEQYPFGDCVPVMAGPGWFNGPGWTDGRGHRDDFSVGYDCNDPEVEDDPGESNWEIEGPVEMHIAEVMVQRYREHPRVKRGEIK